MRILALLLLLGLTPALTSWTQAAGKQTALRGHYFLVVWGYQGETNDVVQSHTFASFYNGEDLAHGIIKPTTISWLPASHIVQPFGVEKGHNFTLQQTLQMACQSGREVRFMGPYEIKPALFQRALKRIELLKSGRIRYSMFDTAHGTMNCIDAAGDLTPTPLDTGISWGFVASAKVVRHLSPYFVRSRKTIGALAGILAPKACSQPRPEMTQQR